MITEDEKNLLNMLKNCLSKDHDAAMFSEVIQNALSYALSFNLGFDHAVLTLKQNDLVEWEKSDWILALKRKISELMLLKHFIMLSGLVQYNDEIMNLHIKKLFGQSDKTDDFLKKFLTDLNKGKQP